MTKKINNPNDLNINLKVMLKWSLKDKDGLYCARWKNMIITTDRLDDWDAQGKYKINGNEFTGTDQELKEHLLAMVTQEEEGL